MVTFSRRTLFFDVEAHSIDELGTMPPEEYVRLVQYAWGEGPVRVSTSLRQLKRQIRKAKMIVGANILSYDFRAVFGDTITGVRLAKAGRVYDTHVAALTAFPPPFGLYTMRNGKTAKSVTPDDYRKWIKLDNLAFQLGVPGKLGDLSEMVDKYTHDWIPQFSEKTGKQLKHPKKVKKPGVCCGYGAIPVDDPEYLAYAEQDVVVVREVARKLLEREPYSEYTKFDMAKTAAWIHVGKSPTNGLRVDIPAAQQRAKDLHEEAAWVLNGLHDTYGFPIHGKKPLASKDGKAALLKALADVGIQEAELPRTAPSESHPEGQPSFSAENILAVTEGRGEAAEKLGKAVATLAGQRSLAELLLQTVHPDGKVHPDIFPLQRSGRNSTTKPGLTIWDPRFKDLLIADSGEELLVEFDYSNADARAVAAMSGDTEFAKRFEPGQDGHLINAHLLWGADTVGWDKKDPKTAEFRQRAKAPGHGIGYNMGATRMADTTGLSLKECKTFIKNYRALYEGVVRWQKKVVALADRYGGVLSDWGRRMVVQDGREHTQTPGLLGQNATHEILSMGLLELDEEHLNMVCLGIHDAFLASIPKEGMEDHLEYFRKAFTRVWSPRGGQPVDFTLGWGTPARTWADAQH